MKVLIGVNEGDLTEDISKVTGVGKYERRLIELLPKVCDCLSLQVKAVYGYMSAISVVKGIIKGFLSDFSSYDIVHFTAPKPFAPIKRRTLLTTVHDLFLIRRAVHPLTRKFYVHSILHSDAVIAISSLVEEDVKKEIDYKGKTFLVNQGIDEKFLSAPPTKFTRDENVKLKLGFIGRVYDEKKNLVNGIKTFKKLKEDRAVFEIWGAQDPKNEVFKRVLREAESDKRVKLMGPAPEDKIIDIYDSFDALFLPSIEEGFGLPILEANARGVPVIVYEDARIPKEVCKFCIKIRDELPSADEILEFKTKLGKEMMSFAKQFTWANTARKTCEVYRSLA